MFQIAAHETDIDSGTAPCYNRRTVQTGETKMSKLSFAWLQVNEATDEEGFYLQDSPELREIERAELKEMGAPDTDEIEFVSILPEDRDSALIEALVTPAFAKWAKAHPETGEEVENGISNLTYYDDTKEEDKP